MKRDASYKEYLKGIDDVNEMNRKYRHETTAESDAALGIGYHCEGYCSDCGCAIEHCACGFDPTTEK